MKNKSIIYLILSLSILFLAFRYYKYRSLMNYLNNPPFSLIKYMNDAVLVLDANPTKGELLSYLRSADSEWQKYLDSSRLNVKEFDGTLVLYDFGYDNDDDNLSSSYQFDDIGFWKSLFQDGDVVIGEANQKIEDLDYIIAFLQNLKKIQFDEIQSLQLDSARRLMMRSYYKERFRVELPYKFGYFPDGVDTCVLILRMENDMYSAKWDGCFDYERLPDINILVSNIDMLQNRNIKIMYWPILIAKDEKSLFFRESNDVF